MLNRLVILDRKNREEGEKPFWISFADLMSALMVLFLLVMSVALLAVTKNVSESERNKAQREQEIDKLLDQVQLAAKDYPGVSVDRDRNVIDFGDRAHFDTGSSKLSNDQAEYLSSFVGKVLGIARNELGKKWVKQIVVEGFADQRGDYLLNLNLSLQRSQRVLCVLLAPQRGQQQMLSQSELEEVRQLFLVGGYSFNSAKKTLEESRRIELRLEFYGLGEPHLAVDEIPPGNFGTCRI